MFALSYGKSFYVIHIIHGSPIEILRRPAAAAEQAVAQLGADIALARRRRRIPQDSMAERMQVSRQTLHRLEHGDRAVSLSVLASALHVLGLAARLGQLASADQDVMAAEADLGHVPQRVRAPSGRRPS